jgi:acyl dehydratase
MTDTATNAQRYFEEVEIGEEYTQTQIPSRENVLEFLSTWSDPGDEIRGRFTDQAGANKDGLQKPIVPGNMSASMITRLVTDWAGPLGRIVSLDISFRRPVQHDDQLTCLALVTERDDDLAEAGGPAIVSIDVSFENERGEKPVQGTAQVELPRRDAE